MSECNFKPYDRVVVRADDSSSWTCDLFCYRTEDEITNYPYVCIGSVYGECLPFEGNEDLIGTRDSYEEPPYEPKDGDFVVIKTNGYSTVTWIAILESIDEDHDEVTTYASMSNNGEDDLSWGSETLCDEKDVISVRPATEEEKQQILSKLHENGKDWDAEKKEVVDWKWEPSDGEEYYFCEFVINSFKVGHSTYVDTGSMPNNIDIVISYKTEEECQAMCDKLNEAIKNVK